MVAEDRARGLGTFGGVFVPNVLTILGVIMFLRLGWVVGNAGLPGALLILLIATAITFLTSLSLSSISTNTRVGAGGAYFLISRSLGLELGGSIGIPLFFAQAISVAFYLIGFSESLQALLPWADQRLVSTLMLGVFVAVAWFGASFIAKAQYVILVLLVLSLASIFTGVGSSGTPTASVEPEALARHGFWAVFAVFFPAVTGIMAGVSMSGDLRDPSRSIPRGTIWAILVTLVIYGAEMVLLSASVDRKTLLTDNMVLLRIASVPQLVYLGLWAATLSSALASLAAAPRTLQALGQDHVVPRVLGRSIGGGREPHVALLVSWAIAQGCILLGDLDLIAPIISMFFLATYGTLNIVSGLERLVSNPSFRPTFRTHWGWSLAGGAGCAAVMVLINAWATLAAVVVIAGVYIYLAGRRLESTWGDMRSGLWFSITRFGLLKYVGRRHHVRNWRPVLLVLVGSPKSRLPMVRFADTFESRRGFLFLAQIVTGAWSELLPRQKKLQDSLRTFIGENGLSAVPLSLVADDFEHGVATLLQVAGIGEFEPNTVMIGWSDDVVRQAMFGRAIRHVLELERNLLVFRPAPEEHQEKLKPTIDVWWYSRDNGSLMLTLAFLLRSNRTWDKHEIRVIRIIRDSAGEEEAAAGTRLMIKEQRVDASVTVIVSEDPPLEVIARESRRSSVCFVGIAVRGHAEGEDPLARYSGAMASLQGNVFLTKSWQDLNY